MVGREAGFATLFTKYVGHPLLGFHCIVREEALCAKAGLEELGVMKIVPKVVNCISALALGKRQFQNLLSEVNSVYKGLLMYSNVRWRSRGSVLQRFVECLDDSYVFDE
jgi:hypothetical protein